MGGKWGKWNNPTSERVDGKTIATKEYAQWSSIQHRTKGSKHYTGVVVSENFQDFDWWLSWSKQQKGFGVLERGGKRWSIDKDIVGDGTIYHEDVCVYVPAEINNMMKGWGGVSNLPSGVKYKGDYYSSSCTYLGCDYYFGVSDNVKHSHSLYLKFREYCVNDIKSRYGDAVDERVYDKLMESCNPDHYDYGIFDTL